LVITIERNIIKDNTGYGIHINYNSHGITIRENDVSSNDYGIWVYRSKSIWINENWIENNVNTGVRIHGTDADKSRDIHIENNVFGNGTNGQNTHIQIGQGQDCFVSDNYFNNGNLAIDLLATSLRINVAQSPQNNLATTLVSNLGTDNNFYGRGFENIGTATNTTATTFVFNHSLAGTPTFVSASFNTTSIDAWTWTADATQITITVTPALTAPATCYWEAKYVP